MLTTIATMTSLLAGAHTPETARPIDLAICLDTSGSMEGLLDAARMKLWEIVNDLALAEPTPELRVALLTFGNNGHDPEQGWVLVDAPLTGDLDLISQKLFALTTNGGEEYVARVTSRATSGLEWHPSTDALKLIIVAGNEAATQDPQFTVEDACRAAIGQGIMVNAIYCGNPADDLAPAWQQVAKLADGHFAAIDQEHGTVVITTPFDDRLAELSAAINETYVPYGAAGETAWANQAQQDRNAATMNTAAAAARCSTKISALYKNAGWDLVDACKEQVVKLEEVEAELLPEHMREMTLEERRAYLEQQAARRATLREEAADLTKQRETFVRKEMERQAIDASRSFGKVVRDAVRSQAAAKGFAFPADPTPVSEPQEEATSGAAETEGDGC